MFKVQFACATDVGLKRKINEDQVSVNKEGRYFILADGMGGHNAGEVASAMAVHLISDFLSSVDFKSTNQILDTIRSAIEYANRSIFEAGQQDLSKRGMGTTVVVGVFFGNQLCYGHVGDSRLYLYRKGLLQQLTEDHTLRQEAKTLMVTADDLKIEEIPSNIVTQALGAKDNVNVSLDRLKFSVGDAFLSCSDGLYDMVDHILIEQTLQQNSDLVMACKQLILKANEGGGRDNITVMMAKPILLSQKINTFLEKLF